MKAGPVIGSAVFFAIAPTVVAGWIPYALSGWRVEPAFLGVGATRIAGGLLVLLGVAVLVDSFARFAVEGEGTPAPVAPTERLVVSGLYRHVRNPMYVAVLCVIGGQGLLLGSVSLLGYAGVVWMLFHLFVVAYEEPTLQNRYGESYRTYRGQVRRWWPRLKPWRSAA